MKKKTKKIKEGLKNLFEERIDDTTANNIVDSIISTITNEDTATKDKLKAFEILYKVLEDNTTKEETNTQQQITLKFD